MRSKETPPTLAPVSAIRLPVEGFVRLPTILEIFPVGRSTWWAGVKSGRYPAPVKLGDRITAWPVESIRGLLESMSDQRRDGSDA